MPGQLDIHTQKNEVASLPHTVYKNFLQMYHRTKCLHAKTMTFLTENIGENFETLG